MSTPPSDPALGATMRELARQLTAPVTPPPSGQGTVLLITGSYAEYCAFLVGTQLPERRVVYVHNLSGLSMFTPSPWVHVVLYGNYWTNPIFNPETEDAALFYLELHADTPLETPRDEATADTEAAG